ncbi:MAG: BREX-1 system adenine-specific DNA-methyltransferase PglX [Lachnospiraceae bacterium]|jgi:hypothetical protein|nr:BREX-1 system adenine-specific DNA-methyltransferase PglX [Lachnospiraceae bacterium]
MDKTAIKNFATEARKILMKSAVIQAGFYGITREECKSPVQKGFDFEVYETVAGTENRIYGNDRKRRANLVKAIEEQGFDQVIEETAYTWFNRMIAIRFMEVNNYLPTRVRVLSSETGSSTPDIVTQADTIGLNLTPEEEDKIQTAKRENRYDDVFRMLFVKQCNALNEILPGLFEKTDDYMELLLKITYTGDGVVRMLVDSVPESNFNVTKTEDESARGTGSPDEAEGQIEIIGWMYQYYNTELKNDTFARLKKNVKITKERIPAATQLFTPDWIVRYMVENSLGRVWMEHLRAVDGSVDEKSKAEEFGWKYYLPEAKQEDNVAAQLVEVRNTYKDLTPQEITCIDPCMGSGHILVYMFDVLMDIYRSEGFSEREAVFDILEKNIRGLDIDRRAYQLSYFALMMKAREYNRVFFRGHENRDGERVLAEPQVYGIEESNSIDRKLLKYFGAGMDEQQKNDAVNQMNGLLDTWKDAKEYGSILNVEDYDWELLRSFVTRDSYEGQMTFESVEAEQAKKLLVKLVDTGEVMAGKYDVVVTNPPYMGGSGMNPDLVEYIRNKYFDYKADLFSAFIVKCSELVNKNGYAGFLTPFVWMFIQTYEKLRKFLYERKQIQSLIHFEYSAFEEATVPICSFTLCNSEIKKRSSFIRLTNFRGGMNIQREKTLEAIKNKACGYYFEEEIYKFDRIPGAPMVYWLGDSIYEYYRNCDVLGNQISSQVGTTLGDNGLFLRIWFEVEKGKETKWFLSHKGGSFRRWYGNVSFVVNWEKDGKAVKDNGRATVRGEKTAFNKGISWTQLTAGNPSFRIKEAGTFIESASCMCRVNDEIYEYVLGYLNSNIVTYILDAFNPTMHFQPGDIARLPWKLDDSYIRKVKGIVDDCIEISRTDWDSFETSWDFKRHPLVPLAAERKDQEISPFAASRMEKFGLVQWHYEKWEDACKNRFRQLKENEEELNRIFIHIYGLQDELIPEIEDKDVTVRKADLGRDIRSLVSYAVGCMFGRYSLDEPGLIYAGGEFDKEKYKTFPVDKDAIIPITDEAYFEDDSAGRFEEFVKAVYGEKSLEQNLDFIAEALGTKGSSSREKIRNYFLNDFFKDHCSTYSVAGSGKRPIYWLFDSGKQNGFKCLVYLHRYTPNTAGLIRSDYLTKTQSMIENALKNAEYAINTSSSAVDRAQATKKRDKYIKQLAEIRAYYPALSHIALQRMKLDLDDGVKVNYAKFQEIEVGGEGEKTQKINLLAKI